MYEQLIDSAPSGADLIAEFQAERNAFEQRLQAAMLAVRYSYSLEIVEKIDRNLESGRQHYRNRAGDLLTTLDQVISAIINDDLAIHKEAF